MGYIKDGKLHQETEKELKAREIAYNLLLLAEYYKDVANHNTKAVDAADTLFLNYCSGKVIKALQNDF